MRVLFFVRFTSVALALGAASFIAFPSMPNSAPLWLTTAPPVSVDRTLKGDRFPLLTPINKSHQFGSPARPEQARFEKFRSDAIPLLARFQHLAWRKFFGAARSEKLFDQTSPRSAGASSASRNIGMRLAAAVDLRH